MTDTATKVIQYMKTQDNKLIEARRKVDGRIFFYKAEAPDIFTELLTE